MRWKRTGLPRQHMTTLQDRKIVPPQRRALRRRIGLELGVLAVLATVFLVLFPKRAWLTDLGLALVALALIAWNAPFTRDKIWALFPPADDDRRVRRAWAVTLGVTAVLVAGVLVLGASIAYRQGGTAEIRARLLNGHIFVAMGVYFVWALLQQTLFQFYLLGRLRVLLPSAAAIVLTGVGYALVHLPDPWITGVTVVTGIFWTTLYDRFRTLVPLAMSHAVLGSTFYYWVYGNDLAAAWFWRVGLGSSM